MRVMVNGGSREVEPGTTVGRLLESLGANPLLVAVEVNVEVLQRDRYGTTVLREGDAVEIVQIVGGGA